MIIGDNWFVIYNRCVFMLAFVRMYSYRWGQERAEINFHYMP